MALRPGAAVAALLGIVPLLVWPDGNTVRWWLFALVLGIGVDVWLAPSPGALSFARSTPRGHVRLGETATSELLVTNTGTRRLSGVLRDAWTPSAGAEPSRHRLDVPAGERVRLVTTLTPTRRGDRSADLVTVRSYGPLGLAARQRSIPVGGGIRALHPFPARRHLPSRLAVLRQLDGRAAARVRGAGTEFDSLRDYVDGDDVRSIDWRATARRRALVVRTWRPEQHRRVVIVLDCSRTSAGRVGDGPRLNAAMDAALLLTALAGHAHDRVQVLAADSEVRARVQGADRARLLHEVIDTLAPVHPRLVEADWGLITRAVTQLTTQRALLILVTPLEPSAVEEGLLPVLPALTERHRVVVASVADPDVEALRTQRSTATQVYDAAAAERTVALRERTAAALRTLGVSVIDALPDELPVRLADHYLALKRAALL